MSDVPQVNAKGILERFQCTEETLKVTLSDHQGDIEIKFRIPANASEWYQIGAGARKFGEMVCSKRRPPDFPKCGSPDVAGQCFWVSSLAVEPHISQRDALDMAARCGTLIPYLFGQIQSRMAEQVMTSEVQETDELLED